MISDTLPLFENDSGPEFCNDLRTVTDKKTTRSVNLESEDSFPIITMMTYFDGSDAISCSTFDRQPSFQQFPHLTLN